MKSSSRPTPGGVESGQSRVAGQTSGSSVEKEPAFRCFTTTSVGIEEIRKFQMILEVRQQQQATMSAFRIQAQVSSSETSCDDARPPSRVSVMACLRTSMYARSAALGHFHRRQFLLHSRSSRCPRSTSTHMRSATCQASPQGHASRWATSSACAQILTLCQISC